MKNPLKKIIEQRVIKEFAEDVEQIYAQLRANGINSDMHWTQFESQALGERSRTGEQMFIPQQSDNFAQRFGEKKDDAAGKTYFISRIDVLGAPDCKGYSCSPNMQNIKDPVDLANTILGILAESKYEFGVSAVEHFDNKISPRGGAVGYFPGGKLSVAAFNEKYKTTHDGEELSRTDFVVLTGSKKHRGVMHVVDIGVMPFRDMYSSIIGEKMDVHNFDYWKKQANDKNKVSLLNKLKSKIQETYLEK